MKMLNTIANYVADIDNSYTHDLSHDSGTIKSYDPSTGQLILEVPLAGKDEYYPISQQLINAQYMWKQVPAPIRGEFIRRLGEKFREHKEDLAEVISVEMGKIYQEK